jgi:hypothetical protein
MVAVRLMQTPSLDEIVYCSRFSRWDERASVRAKPQRIFAEEEAPRLLYFPPELVPMSSHELVARGGVESTNRVLMQRLHVYLDFTAELEQQVVNPVCAAIGRGRSGLYLPAAMLEDAFKIYTDEAWHAQFSDDLQRQIVKATGVPAVRPRSPAFMRNLDTTQRELPSDMRALSSLFVAIVSETLISAILADIPRDTRVIGAVREVISDHAIDEGLHHVFFANLLEHAWPQVSSRHRAMIGVRLPGYIRAFLEPDVAALADVLFDVGLCADDVGQVLVDAYGSEQVDRTVRDDARVTLRHLARFGVLDDPATIEAFQEARLLDSDGVAGLGADIAISGPAQDASTKGRP